MSATTVEIDTTRPTIPLVRLLQVELRKMFDTRAGRWLLISIAVLSVLAAAAVIAFAPDDVITFATFSTAFGVPLGVLLPVVAILAVTGEWSQRGGLTTFTLVPNRASVIWAKALASVVVGVAALLVAFGVGALGNVIGAAINGVDMVWDVSIRQFFLILLANVLGLLLGFTLGALFRNTPAAIVGYFVYSLVLPGLFQLLAALQDWFDNIQPWVDFNSAQAPLFEGNLDGEQWAQLGTSGLIWFVIPFTAGILMIMRSEVK
ncbi:ABC transporter permease [Aeromicrobium sp. CF3.5]|uniref:ABC transporter permease n=1 Tax=Aeromicrobium sp. CF3.5 TaxID=3373078 RepID=UPI003EE42591